MPLPERVRYAAGSVLAFSWWYGLGGGAIVPAALVDHAEVARLGGEWLGD